MPVHVTDAQLERIGEANPGWKVEMVRGHVVMSPTNADASVRNSRLNAILSAWADAHGYVCFDSSTGIRIGPKDVLSPDCSLVPRASFDALGPSERRKFWPRAPEVVVELISSKDDARTEHRKCARWYESGATFVLALNPYGPPKARTWGVVPPDFPTDWSAVVD